MDCDDLRDDMLDVLYGEAAVDARRRVEDHRHQCPACRQELAAFQQLRKDLAQWKAPAGPSAAFGPRLVTWRRPPVWLAAAAALVLVLGAALRLSGSAVRYEGGQLSLRLGAGPSELESRLQAQEARHQREIAALRQALAQAPRASSPAEAGKLLATMAGMIQESERRQAVQFRADLAELSAKSEAQRRYDLARVSAGLSYLEGRTGHDVARTTELMGYVLQAAEKR